MTDNGKAKSLGGQESFLFDEGDLEMTVVCVITKKKKYDWKRKRETERQKLLNSFVRRS